MKRLLGPSRPLSTCVPASVELTGLRSLNSFTVPRCQGSCETRVPHSCSRKEAESIGIGRSKSAYFLSKEHRIHYPVDARYPMCRKALRARARLEGTVNRAQLPEGLSAVARRTSSRKITEC